MRSMFVCATLSLALLAALPGLTGSAAQARPPGSYPGYSPGYSPAYFPLQPSSYHGSYSAYPSYSGSFYYSGTLSSYGRYHPTTTYYPPRYPASGYYVPRASFYYLR